MGPAATGIVITTPKAPKNQPETKEQLTGDKRSFCHTYATSQANQITAIQAKRQKQSDKKTRQSG